MRRRTKVDGILSDAREAFEKLLPLPEIPEAQDLIGHTLGSVLDMFQVGWGQLVVGPLTPLAMAVALPSFCVCLGRGSWIALCEAGIMQCGAVTQTEPFVNLM